MTVINRRLSLQYTPGTFSFRHFRPTATDAQLYELATALNAFQTCEFTRLSQINVSEF